MLINLSVAQDKGVQNKIITMLRECGSFFELITLCTHYH